MVFHAAAYKHVGLMEENPVEAVRNNAVATRIVAAAAGEAGVERFVLVSTDKAVTPATVMGASKALAEWAVEAAQNRYRDTRYAAVRFGNVLGSSGSVVPIFRRQIAAGGPVTVTDENMSRYFMTIPEAVQLIIRSGELLPVAREPRPPRGGAAAADDRRAPGTIYVLEMGDPVKIVDLARNMIRLSGKEPDVDIAIEVVGRRPGEKIHEELFEPGERPQPTPAEKIVAAVRPRLDPEWVESAFARIEELVYDGDAAALAAAVAELSAERALAGSASAGGSGLRRRLSPGPFEAAARTKVHSSGFMEIIEQIGSYAGLAAVLGLASVGALLLAGAGRQAPARMGRPRARAHRRGGADPAAACGRTARAQATRGSATGARSPAGRRSDGSPGGKPPVPVPGERRRPRHAAAGAAPAVATGPAAATPAAARSAGGGTGAEEPAAAPARAPTAPTSRRRSPRTP